MLPNYSSLKVAEQFRLLEAIAPGRIDLGVGCAHGCDLATALALNPRAEGAFVHFRSQVRDLMAWVSGAELAEDHPHRGIAAQPRGPSSPQMWMLGSSARGAQVAAHFGLPFCFAHFIAAGRGVGEALAVYRETYQPSERHPQPHAALCVWATAADASSCTDVEKAEIARLGNHLLYGTPEEVGGMLRNLGTQHGVDDLVLLTTVGDPDARKRSYALLAEEFNLEPARVQPRDRLSCPSQSGR
jgi:alkanesulfonate monooxygenase SsuD/methylene tetrahydromethanopterin reductase-like flavin-dependent oxidoreductase (luciferase family)